MAASYDASVTREHAVYHAYSLQPFLDRVATESAGGVAVDLGCGTGVVALALAKRGFRVVGVDHSPEMLRIAERKAAGAGLGERIELREADVLAAELEAGSADVVTCQGVLHHLHDPGPCVELIGEVLRPGGSFYISEPCADPTPLGRAIGAGVRLALAARRLTRRGNGPASPQSVEAPIRSAELFAALERAGLEYEAEFLTHIPLAHSYLPDRVRLRIELLISRPWRRRRGDIVFVEGRKR